MSKNLRHDKDPCSTKEIIVGKIHGRFSKFLLFLYQVCLLVTARELWLVNQEVLVLIWGSTIDQ
jgi:hypothetical protein